MHERRALGTSREKVYLPLAGAQATNGPTKASMKFIDPPSSSGPAKLTFILKRPVDRLGKYARVKMQVTAWYLGAHRRDLPFRWLVGSMPTNRSLSHASL